MPALVRFALRIVVGKKPLLFGRIAPLRQSDNHHMHMRHAPCVRTPGERPVRERDLQSAAAKQDRPELRHLLALRNGIGGHETDLRRTLLHVFSGPDEPCRHVVERAAALAQRRDPPHLRPLLRRLELCPPERRIAEHIRTVLRRQHLSPVHLQRIPVHDVRRRLERDAHIRLPEFQAEAVVHDVIHHPQSHLGDPSRKFSQLDPVELIDIHHRKQTGQHIDLPSGPGFFQHLDFQGAQLPVGDNQKVAAAAGGVEEAQFAEPLLEGEQFRKAAAVAAGLEPGELRPKIVEKERFDDLENVLFGGVVSALPSPLVLVHDGLEQGAEDGRGDVRPVEPAGVEQALPHGGVERGDAERPVEKVPVHVGEAAEVLVEIAGAFVFRRIEDLEELGEPSAEVRTVFPRAVLQQVEEDVPGFEDAGVVREEAEDDADKELLQIVPLVAGGFKRVVEVAYPFGGLDVDGVLILERALLYAEDEAELLHMSGQVFERKGYVLVFVQIVEFERPEIAQQDIARQIGILEAGEVGEGLRFGLPEVAPRAFLLHEQDPLPEEVDEPALLAQQFYGFLERRHPPHGHAEYVEESPGRKAASRPFRSRPLPTCGRTPPHGSVFHSRTGACVWAWGLIGRVDAKQGRNRAS